MNDVIYIGARGPQINWLGCDDLHGILNLQCRYSVLRTEEHSWHTRIILKDFPEKAFNSAYFQEVVPDQTANSVSEYRLALEAYMAHAKPVLRAMADLHTLYTSPTYTFQGTTITQTGLLWHNADASRMYEHY